MAATEALTYEKVWEMFQETDRKIRETSEQMKETDRKFQETREQMKETDRRMKETDRKIGELGNRFGELAEHLVAPSINEKFNDLGFNFNWVSDTTKIKDLKTKQTIIEIDILLQNSESVIAVEVKSKPKEKDISDYIEKMEILRQEADKKNDTRKYYGAIAGAIMGDTIRRQILQEGFYLIEQTGDTVKITIPEGFIAREW